MWHVSCHISQQQ